MLRVRHHEADAAHAAIMNSATVKRAFSWAGGVDDAVAAVALGEGEGEGAAADDIRPHKSNDSDDGDDGVAAAWNSL
jgi:hypothetical protein